VWVGGGGGAQQNRVTPSPLDFGLWTLDLDCDKIQNISVMLQKLVTFYHSNINTVTQ